MKVLLVGTGYMSAEYAKVLVALNISFDVIGRGPDNCTKFRESFKQIEVYEGGVESFQTEIVYTYAIIATNVNCLAQNTRSVIKLGIKNILLEKPGGTNKQDILSLNAFANEHQAQIVIAYNRRFYSSVLKCQEGILNDGGATSFHFEFTEWSHTISLFDIENDIKQNWILANSSHVIDTAFYLCGLPDDITCYKSGSLDWHTTGSIYTGAGKTVKDTLFSYIANWQAPGRWNLEIMTKLHRYILKPMEKLQIMQIGSVDIGFVTDIDYSLDEQFKPGLYLQTKAFLENDL